MHSNASPCRPRRMLCRTRWRPCFRSARWRRRICRQPRALPAGVARSAAGNAAVGWCDVRRRGGMEIDRHGSRAQRVHHRVNSCCEKWHGPMGGPCSIQRAAPFGYPCLASTPDRWHLDLTRRAVVGLALYRVDNDCTTLIFIFAEDIMERLYCACSGQRIWVGQRPRAPLYLAIWSRNSAMFQDRQQNGNSWVQCTRRIYCRDGGTNVQGNAGPNSRCCHPKAAYL